MSTVILNIFYTNNVYIVNIWDLDNLQGIKQIFDPDDNF